MKKLRLAATLPLCLAAIVLPLSSCGKSEGTTSTPITSNSSDVGKTLITVEGSDRGVAVGESLTLHSTVYGPSPKIHYVSTDTSIATVDNDGKVTGVKPGFVSIHAVSDYDTAVYGSFTLFVEPTYIRDLVKGFRGNDYASGVSFAGQIGLMLTPATGSSTEDDATLKGPFTFALQNRTYPFSDGTGSFTVPSFDLRISPETTISSLISMILGKSSYKAKNFSFASLALSALTFYSQEDSDAGLFGFYQPVNFTQRLDTLLPSLLAVASVLPAEGIVSEFAAFFEKVAPKLNEWLSFDTDAKVGISLKSSVIDAINTRWPDVLAAIKNSTSLSDTLKAFLPMMLPESFKDVRFSVSSNNGTFTGLTFQITGLKEAGSPSAPTEYHPLTITLTAPTALASTYFDDLGTAFATAENDQTLISQLTSADATLYAILSDYNNDLYDTLHHSKPFVRAVKKYNANTYPLLAQVVNTPLVPSQRSDSSTVDYHYGPYESFDVMRQGDAQKNILWDNYAPSAGDVFTLSTVKPVGDATTSFQTAPGYSFSLTGGDSITVSDYVTLEAGVLTIKKLPTSSKLTLKITPDTVEGYSPLTYTMSLNTVAA